MQAIEFTMEEGDEDLWELLISLSIHKPSTCKPIDDVYIAVKFNTFKSPTYT